MLNFAALMVGPTKYLIIALAIAVASSVGMGYGWRSAERANGSIKAELSLAQKALRTAQEASKRAQVSAHRLASEVRAQRALATQAQQALSSALAKSPEWATQEIPKEVQDAITGK